MTQLPRDNVGPSIDVLAKELESEMKNSIVLTPDSEGYSDIIKRWSNAAEKRAVDEWEEVGSREEGMVACVTCAEDVSVAVLFSQTHSLEVAVCGGGHSTSGSSSTSDGIVIDLRQMKKVTVDPKERTIIAQGGCLLKDVDEAVAEHGLIVVGGNFNHTGIGGMTLDGGYGFLTGRYGLMIDNLLEVTMVVADGRITKASAVEHAGLFWAVRGAGQCFGVAADFTFRAHAPEPAEFWAGQLCFPAESKLEAVAEFANRFIESTNGKSAMVIVVHWPPFMSEIAVTTHLFHNGREEDAMDAFAPLLALGPAAQRTAERPYAEINALQSQDVRHGMRRVLKGACFLTPIQPSFVSNLLEELSQFYQRVPDARGGSAIILELYATEKQASVAPAATAFANRGHHQNSQVATGWTDPANDEVCKLWVSHIAQKFGNELDWARNQRGNPPELENITEYGNYNGLGSADARRIFGVNYRRVALLKGQYDPDDVFKGSYPDLRKDLYLPWDPDSED